MNPLVTNRPIPDLHHAFGIPRVMGATISPAVTGGEYASDRCITKSRPHYTLLLFFRNRA